MRGNYLLGIDQGTSGSRALVLDAAGEPRGYGYRALPRLHPHPDWVEQDPRRCARGGEAVEEAVHQAGIRPQEIAACGIACQRNTDFVWEADTISPAGKCHYLAGSAYTGRMPRCRPGPGGRIRRRLGRLPGTVSSALHMAWRVSHDPAVQEAIRTGKLRMGFSAEWLLAAMGRLDGHWMDYTLVQANGLYDFRKGGYWQEWLIFWGWRRHPASAEADGIPYGSLRSPRRENRCWR